MQKDHKGLSMVRNRVRTLLRFMFGWDRNTLVLFLGFWLSFIVFDALWCLGTTFNPFSHFPLYVGSIGFSLLFTLPYVIWQRKWPCIVLLVLLQLLIVANLMYSRTYLEAIPLRSYMIADNLADFMPAVWASIRWADLIFPIITAAVLLLLRTSSDTSGQRTSLKGYLLCLAIPVICTIIVLPTPEHFRKAYAKYSNGADSYRNGPVQFTLFGKLYYDLLTFSAPLTDAERTETLAFIKARPKIPSLPEGMKPRKNLVVVMCESLESWPIGLTYEGHKIMPYVSELLNDSTTLYAPNVLSQAKGGRSIDGQLLLFTGLLPIQEGSYATTYPNSTFPSLQQAAKAARGTRSYLFTGDKSKVWNQIGVAGHLGIDTIISYPDFRVEESYKGHRKHIGDRALMHQIVEKLQSGTTWNPGEPAMIHIVTYSGHSPFNLPDKEHCFTLSGEAPEMMENYMYVCRYVDEALSVLIEYLRSRPDWEDTMVVITGDHEGLAENRASLAASPQGKGVINPTPMVPLVIVNSPIGGRFDFQAAQEDIYPTLLQLLGLHDYVWPGFGYSLLDPAHPHSHIDPYGKQYGTPSDPSVSVRQHEAWKHSDRILKYDLMRGAPYSVTP